MMIDDAALLLTRCNARINYIRHISDANSTWGALEYARCRKKEKRRSLYRSL